ncbi:MAG: arylamine N-acetyltransferase [Aureispira sp.]|nr:arylamine N-acetyltransferase [Aureispira sp.]
MNIDFKVKVLNQDIMDIKAYLKRLHYQKETKVSKEVLWELQQAHLLTVPFENLDIHYQQKISLDLETIFDKVVLNKRGGFCYELNGLFYALLKSIGFEAKMISGRVATPEKTYGPEYDHLAIVVRIEGIDYLVDVGFGRFSLAPLEIQMQVPIVDALGVFQFEIYKKEYLQINSLEKETAIAQYIFKLQEREWAEFEEMCCFHQKSANSHFTQKKIISILTPNGRITLNDKWLKITTGGEIKEIEFEAEEFPVFLKTYFNITL